MSVNYCYDTTKDDAYHVYIYIEIHTWYLLLYLCLEVHSIQTCAWFSYVWNVVWNVHASQLYSLVFHPEWNFFIPLVVDSSQWDESLFHAWNIVEVSCHDPNRVTVMNGVLHAWQCFRVYSRFHYSRYSYLYTLFTVCNMTYIDIDYIINRQSQSSFQS